MEPSLLGIWLLSSLLISGKVTKQLSVSVNLVTWNLRVSNSILMVSEAQGACSKTMALHLQL